MQNEPTNTEEQAQNHTPTPSAPQQPANDETMQVSVSKMQAIMDTLAQLQKRDSERDNEIAILRESVSRGRLQEAEDKRKVKGPPKAKLMIYNGKIVTGWKMQSNEMIYLPQNLEVPAGEKLTIKLKFIDDSESDIIPYVNFIRAQERADVAKVREEGINWVVRFDDPEIYSEELVIDPMYLNP